MLAQRLGGAVGVARHLQAQQFEVLSRESPGVSAAVRQRAEVAPLPVLAEHLLDEGLADAEACGHLFEGGVAALDCGDDLLP